MTIGDLSNKMQSEFPINKFSYLHQKYPDSYAS